MTLLAGIAMTVLGVTNQQVPAATAGGLFSFLGGIAALSGRIVPALINAAGGVLARLIGPVGSLAAGNAGRNPRRTSATATALLIGVALTSTLVVGIATVKEAAPAAMDSQFPPVDVMVSSSGSAPLPAVGHRHRRGQRCRRGERSGQGRTDDRRARFVGRIRRRRCSGERCSAYRDLGTCGRSVGALAR